jgi:DNA-binding NarL/FixJ family response regulator
MTTRIMLVDDHLLVRQGLRALLNAQPDLEVVADTANGPEAVDVALAAQPDVVVMELSTLQLDETSITHRLHDQVPNSRIIILSGNDEETGVICAVRAGAIGYLPKTTSVEAVVRTIQAAMRGEVTFSASASARLVEALQHPVERSEQLTCRELEVLNYVALGRSNKEIAWELQISEKTVKSHVSTILSKFGLESRTQAALHATRLGLVREEVVPRAAAATAQQHAIIALDFRRPARRTFACSSAPTGRLVG